MPSKYIANGDHPIHYAAKNGHIQTVELLVELGEKVDVENEVGNQPIHFAAEHEQLEMVKQLLEMRAKIDCVNDNGFQPIHVAALAREATEGVEGLIALGAKVPHVTPFIFNNYYLGGCSGRRIRIATNPLCSDNWRH